MASDEPAHFDILIPLEEGPQDDQYLSGCVHGAGIDEVLRREGSQSSESTQPGTDGQCRRGPGREHRMIAVTAAA